MLSVAMRQETLSAIKYQLRADPSISQAEIPKLLSRLREAEPNSTEAPPYLGIAAAARYAAASRWTINRWVKQGLLRATRIGGVTRIRRTDLDTLLSSGGVQ